jgi:hypothetical protein
MHHYYFKRALTQDNLKIRKMSISIASIVKKNFKLFVLIKIIFPFLFFLEKLKDYIR